LSPAARLPRYLHQSHRSGYPRSDPRCVPPSRRSTAVGDGGGRNRQREVSLEAVAANRVRIIGGEWRSRWVKFPDIEGLRPTPDRVRETVFNWLGQDLTGLACLDLFAGSGA